MNTKKRTFLILTPGFAANESDTTCLPFLQTFLKGVKGNYPELHIIVLAFQYPYRRDLDLWNGIEVFSFNGRNRRKLFKLLLWKRILNKLEKLNHETNIVGLLSIWCHECAFIGKKFSNKHRLKHYCWIWGQDAKKENKFVKRIRPKGDEIVALSDFLQSEFEKNFSIKPTHVILPAIDENWFDETNFKKDIDIIGVGSLIPLKRYDIFLKVTADLKQMFPELKVVLCGKGPEEKELKNLSEKLHLTGVLHFTGELPYPEVLQYMQRSKILLHTSSYEGFSGVCQEALFAGAHVVSFCRAMNKPIDHWHIVNDMDGMKAKATELLLSSQESFNSIEINCISETVASIMKLFDYKEAITS